MRDEKEERKKQARSNKQTNKAKQHSTPKAVTFPRKNELPRVGLKPMTLYTRDRALYQLSYRGSSAGWAQISHLIAHLMNMYMCSVYTCTVTMQPTYKYMNMYNIIMCIVNHPWPVNHSSCLKACTYMYIHCTCMYHAPFPRTWEMVHGYTVPVLLCITVQNVMYAYMYVHVHVHVHMHILQNKIQSVKIYAITLQVTYMYACVYIHMYMYVELHALIVA